MTGRDTQESELDRPGIAGQFFSAVLDAITGPRALGMLLSLVVIVVAGIVAPGATPGWWTWLRVLLVWLLASVALTSIAGATFDEGGPRVSPILVWGSLLLTVVVSITFTPLAAALAIAILLLLLFNLRTGNEPQPAMFWLFVTVLTPLWVWSAFEAWDRWLLMLVPIGTGGMLAMEHASRSDTPVAARFACWIVVNALAAILLAVALLADIDPGWIAAGGVVATALAMIDVFAMDIIGRDLLSRIALPILALAALTFGWLEAL